MHQNEIDRHEFFQRIRSEAFKNISRRSMNQWRILMGYRRGKLDSKTYRFLERAVEYFSDSEDGINECRFLGITPPDYADDIIEWIQNALTFDEFDTIRFHHNNHKHLRGTRYENNLARHRNHRR